MNRTHHVCLVLCGFALFFASHALATSDEELLLIAIRDNPDEDTPRLIYADWLDEHNQPIRAEFIRISIALARHDADQRQAERIRYNILLLEHNDELVPPADQKLLRRGAIGYSWDRGFITAVKMDVRKASEDGAAEVYRRFIMLNDLTLTWNEEDQGALEPNVYVEAMNRLRASPSAKHLRRLNLRASSMQFLSGFALDHFPNLRELDLGQNNLSNVSALFQGPLSPNLRWLSLENNDLSPSQIDGLLGSKSLPGLEVLGLRNNVYHYHRFPRTVGLTGLKALAMDLESSRQLSQFMAHPVFDRLQALDVFILAAEPHPIDINPLVQRFVRANPKRLVRFNTPYPAFNDSPAVKAVLARNREANTCAATLEGFDRL